MDWVWLKGWLLRMRSLMFDCETSVAFWSGLKIGYRRVNSRGRSGSKFRNVGMWELWNSIPGILKVGISEWKKFRIPKLTLNFQTSSVNTIWVRCLHLLEIEWLKCGNGILIIQIIVEFSWNNCSSNIYFYTLLFHAILLFSCCDNLLRSRICCITKQTQNFWFALQLFL